MCFASKPKHRRNAIEGKINKQTKTLKQIGKNGKKKIKQEHAKTTIIGRGGSTHQDFSEYFSGTYGKQEKLIL